MGLVVKYINNDQDLVKFLMIDKRSHEALKMRIYKQALLYSQLDRLKQKRLSIWQNILKINTIKEDYQDLKKQLEKDPKKIKNVEEVIVLDVARSAHNMGGVDPKILTELLKTYAFYNEEIEYC